MSFFSRALPERPSKLAHVLFWVLLFMFPLSFNSLFFDVCTALFRTSVPMLFIILVAYGNAFFVQRYLLRYEKLRLYHPFLVYAIVIPLCLVSVEHIFQFINYLTGFELTMFVEARQDGVLVRSTRSTNGIPRSVVVASVLLVFFVSSIYGLGGEVQRRNRLEASLKATNLRHELKLLRQQINPHFLFNALNNLYAIVQLDPTRAGDFVLKLSDMLRYVTYDCQQERVPLQKEVNYLNNYLYFQQWRDQEFQRLEVDLETPLPELQVEPMLLLPFVENAFKHSYDPQHHQERWIRIALSVNDQQLHFEVTNSRSSTPTTETLTDEYTGIGIENVRKRLALLYPNQHQLLVQADDQQHHIFLTLQLPTTAS